MYVFVRHEHRLSLSRVRVSTSVVMAGTAKEEKDGEFGGPGGMHMLDTGTSDRSVWLLKVPPLVGNSWSKQQDGGPSLAKVTMSMDPLNPNPADSLEVCVLVQPNHRLGMMKSCRNLGFDDGVCQGGFHCSQFRHVHVPLGCNLFSKFSY